MKKLVTLAFAVLLVGIVACQKQNAEPTRVVESKTTARQIFEQQKTLLPKTKFGDVHDVVKPLPGDFTPLWEQAVEKMVGATTAVNVPIASAVSYTAVYPCENHGDADHQHHEIQVVQKLIVVTAADSSVCYIENIVPSEECELTAAAINESFMYGQSMAGFTGFAAYHNFDGTLSHIDRFDNGTKTATAQRDNAELISDITAGVKLYPTDTKLLYNRLSDFDPTNVNTICNLCYIRCGFPCDPFAVYDLSYDKQYKLYEANQANREKHCMICRKLKPCQCPKPGGGGSGTICSVCRHNPCECGVGASSCAFCGSGECLRVDIRVTPEIVHRQILFDHFNNLISRPNLHSLQAGCYYVDQCENSSGDEYMHNIRLPLEDQLLAHNKVRNFFIKNIKNAKSSTQLDYGNVGEALHPILDWYVPIDKRVSMLNYFNYDQQRYTTATMGMITWGNQGTELMRIYNLVLQLPQNPTDAQVGSIFDSWANSKDR